MSLAESAYGSVFGFPPQVVREWTAYQVRMMTTDPKQMGDVLWMPMDQAVAMQEARKKKD